MTLRRAPAAGAGGDARAGRDRPRPRAPRPPGHDRRPGARLRAADDAVVAARPRRGGRRAAADDRRDPARLRRSATRAGDAGWPRPPSCWSSAYVVDLAWLRTTPWRERLAASFDLPERRPALRACSTASPIRHQPSFGRRARCCWPAGWPRGWAGAVTLEPIGRGGSGAQPAATDRRWRSSSSPPIRTCPGLAGVTCRAGRVSRCRSTAARAACAREQRSDGQDACGRCSAPRAARAGSSARASGRRCCAIRPTGRRSSAAAEAALRA